MTSPHTRLQEKYNNYRNARLRAQRPHLTYNLWKQEYATNAELQREGAGL